MNLTSYLAFAFLDETLARSRSPQEADFRLQELEHLLNNTQDDKGAPPSPEETRLLQSYLDSSVEELTSLSPEVNTWFLERTGLRAGTRMQREPQDEKQRIARLFFLAERGVQRYIAIGALLAIDEHLEVHDISSVAIIWDHIWGDEGLTDAAKDDSVSSLTDILLDHYLASGRSRYATDALGQLLRSEQNVRGHILQQSRPVYSRIEARVLLLGESHDTALAFLLRAE
jgi:hypothetical protein